MKTLELRVTAPDGAVSAWGVIGDPALSALKPGARNPRVSFSRGGVKFFHPARLFVRNPAKGWRAEMVPHRDTGDIPRETFPDGRRTASVSFRFPCPAGRANPARTFP